MLFWEFIGSAPWAQIFGIFQHFEWEFQHEGATCILQGLKQGPQLSVEGSDSFRLPKQEQKGVFLQLISCPNHCFSLQGHH